MADLKITELTEHTTPAPEDLLPIVDDPSGSPITKKTTLQHIADFLASLAQTLTGKTLTSPLFQGDIDGWVSASETWTYASADAPTFTFTISGDLTGKYSAGMRIKLTQTTVKYFIITKVAYSSPNTTITVYGGTDYTLVDATISVNYYSTQKAPLGFPLDPIKWTVIATDTTNRTQSSPTNGTWYNLGDVSVSIPIGAWEISYQLHPYIVATTTAPILTTLSTANNSQSDTGFTAKSYVSSQTGLATTHHIRKHLTLTSKTVYYLNTMTDIAGITSINNYNATVPLNIYVVCDYL